MAQIPFFKPALYRKDMDAVLQTMVDEKIGPGEKKKAYIKSFSSYYSLMGGIALRSYIDAIVIALSAFSLESGDSVAVSVFTPLVYLEAFKRIGIKAYMCDIDEDMFIDSSSVKKGIENGVKAIVLFLPLGCLIKDGEKLKEFGLPIIEDVTQSVGSRLGDIKGGNVGDIVIASSEENAIVSTAGGAIVMTNRDDLLQKMQKEVNPYIELPDMNASLGIVQLEKLSSIVERRSSIYKIYLDEARRKNAVKVFGTGDIDFQTNGYGFSCVTNSRPSDVIEMVKKYQVSVQKTFSKAVGSRYEDCYDKFPVAFPYLTRAVSFPLYPFLSNIEIQTVQKAIGILR